jgi:hypothetical protein
MNTFGESASDLARRKNAYVCIAQDLILNLNGERIAGRETRLASG